MHLRSLAHVNMLLLYIVRQSMSPVSVLRRDPVRTGLVIARSKPILLIAHGQEPAAARTYIDAVPSQVTCHSNPYSAS